jgi:protein-tyrosine phosphatase
MDRSNFHNLLRICPEVHTHKVHLVLEPTTGGEVPDPYYGGAGGFDHVHDLLVGALSAWLDQLEAGSVS